MLHLYIVCGIGGIRMTDTLLSRILQRSSCNLSTKCIEWHGAKSQFGYGKIRHDGKQKAIHRMIWEMNNGPISGTLCILHKCDNPSCFNLDHLSLGTRLDNYLDMVGKGRKHLKWKMQKLKYGHGRIKDKINLPHSTTHSVKRLVEPTSAY